MLVKGGPGVFISALIDPCTGSNLKPGELALSVRTLVWGLSYTNPVYIPGMICIPTYNHHKRQGYQQVFILKIRFEIYKAHTYESVNYSVVIIIVFNVHMFSPFGV